MTVDTSELFELARDLENVPKTAGKYIRQAVEVTARKVKDTWAESAGGLKHAPLFPRSITYDLKGLQAFGFTVLSAEVGPDKTRPQGALGNLIEFGSINNPPQMLGLAALEANSQDFIDGLNIAVADALKENGL
ncbi:hypothetical protein [Canibacter oris]|uniref:HK97 gp10 family phage protein n=1 Tax=Canibacter oris TaxID=1365628 RepID=A0A840DPX4_9MICO|nr:hypothetical protein [Canibacter oris]MBB4072048.1 hypothetical protein [Canibacter oris]